MRETDIRVFAGICEYCDQEGIVMHLPSLGLNVDSDHFRMYQTAIEVQTMKVSHSGRAEVAAIRHVHKMLTDG